LSRDDPIITEAQFNEVARACDRILRHPRAGIEWMAIPWLHVLSQHPIHLAWYAGLFTHQQAGGSKTPWRSSLQEGKALATRMAKLGRSFVRAGACRIGRGKGYPRIAAGNLLTPPIATVDVVILSWLVHVDHLESREDFYFGNLQSMLEKRGLSSLLLLRNQSHSPTIRLLKRARRDGPCSRMMLPDANAFREELTLLSRCVRARGRLGCLLRKSSTPLERKVIRRARREQVSEEAVGNLRLHDQIREICRQTNPSMVMGMYEGHASERCAWHAVRSSSSDQRICVGYQHTTLRRHAYAAKRSIGKDRQYDPDIILTLGDATRRTLMACKGLEGIDFITFGTHRRGRGGPKENGPKSGSTFLVLPEGIPSECIYLFDFALECARRLPQSRFIFRTHPVLPFERIQGKLRGYGEGPANVEISRHRDIDDDFARSSNLLYRGSSAVFYAVLGGLKPFYVSKAHEMDIDPLHEISRWREHVHSVDDLVDKYKSHQSKAPGQSLGDWQRVRDYCQNYALPPKEGAVDVLLQMVEKRMGAQKISRRGRRGHR